MNQEDKYQSDYFYAPESALRYTETLDQAREHLTIRPARLIDIGCGNGALAQYVEDDFLYHGFITTHQQLKKQTLEIGPRYISLNLKFVTFWIGHSKRQITKPMYWCLVGYLVAY